MTADHMLRYATVLAIHADSMSSRLSADTRMEERAHLMHSFYLLWQSKR